MTPTQAVDRLIRETDERRHAFERLAEQSRTLFQVGHNPVQIAAEKANRELAILQRFQAFV